MQENSLQAAAGQSPSQEEDQTEDALPPTTTASPPHQTTSPQPNAGVGLDMRSPKNGHVGIVTPVGPLSGNSCVGHGSNPEQQHHRAGYPLHSASSSESISEAAMYPVPIRYRSNVGAFEDHVAAGFASLYLSSELSDVTIACEGKLIKAHRLVLSISSSYFRQIFEDLHDFPCQHPVVILHGLKIKDWENIMRLIYCGIVHINSTEIDDFIAAAECLKIDGLCEELNSSHDDVTPPYEYVSRLPEYHSPEASGSIASPSCYDHNKAHSYGPYSPEDFSTGKDYRRGRSVSPEASQRTDEPGSTNLAERTAEESPGRVRVISSAQSSPGAGSHCGRDSILKVDTRESHLQAEDSSDETRRPPSCPEELRVYRRTSSPAESRIQAVRHPVISRTRDISGSGNDDAFESHQSHANIEFVSPSRVVIAKNLRQSPYHSGWEARSHHGEPAIVVEDTERPFRGVISGQRSPLLSSGGHGVNARFPLSGVSRQTQGPIPIQQLLHPAMLQGIAPLHLLAQQGPRSPHGELTGGMIPTVPSPHISPQNIHEQQQPTTLAMLRAKIAAGQQIYSRGCRSDKQLSSSNNPYMLSKFPSSALGSASQLSPIECYGSGPSASNYAHPPLSSPQQHGSARPKTKAIRSSQVPQSARYTAAEVDAMVDKVQNFPGNMVPCAICSKFVKRERLRAHIHECHLLQGKRIVCPHCGIGLKSKGSYRVHIWRHKRGALPAGRQKHAEQSTTP